MPIRPENRNRYPADWRAISNRIRFVRAAGRCECRGQCGRPSGHLDRDDRCRNVHGAPAYGTGSVVVLTTAHLNHTPEDCHDKNLAAMCQGCHLHYDRAHHAETRAAQRQARLEERMTPLFHIRRAGRLVRDLARVLPTSVAYGPAERTEREPFAVLPPTLEQMTRDREAAEYHLHRRTPR
jgi:hypothetical protein